MDTCSNNGIDAAHLRIMTMKKVCMHNWAGHSTVSIGSSSKNTKKNKIICGTKPFDKSFVVIKHRILYLTFQLKLWLVYFVCFIHVTHNYVMQLQLYYYYYYYWQIGVCSNHRLIPDKMPIPTMPDRKFVKFNKHFNEELCSIWNRLCLEVVREVLLMEKSILSTLKLRRNKWSRSSDTRFEDKGFIRFPISVYTFPLILMTMIFFNHLLPFVVCSFCLFSSVCLFIVTIIILFSAH